jgi:hypothetical protein
MASFYLDKRKDEQGYNQIHRKGCELLPEPEYQEYLGEFDVCMLAIAKAKKIGYKEVNGCLSCTKPCFFEGYVDK